MPMKRSIFIGFLLAPLPSHKGEEKHKTGLFNIHNFFDHCLTINLPLSYIGNTLAPSAVKQ